ncbi:Tn3 family transposase [Streptosporangium roseum]|nr:Tn3 family transposase [Streptosporangium roseum]
MLSITAREAHYVLDDLLGNATDLQINEHATDSHGRRCGPRNCPDRG